MVKLRVFLRVISTIRVSNKDFYRPIRLETAMKLIREIDSVFVRTAQVQQVLRMTSPLIVDYPYKPQMADFR